MGKLLISDGDRCCLTCCGATTLKQLAYFLRMCDSGFTGAHDRQQNSIVAPLARGWRRTQVSRLTLHSQFLTPRLKCCRASGSRPVAPSPECRSRKKPSSWRKPARIVRYILRHIYSSSDVLISGSGLWSEEWFGGTGATPMKHSELIPLLLQPKQVRISTP